eukprot:401950_1
MIAAEVFFVIGFVGGISIVATLICLNTFYQLCIQDSSTWINKTYRNLTIIAMMSYTLSSIGDCVRFIAFFDQIVDGFYWTLPQLIMCMMMDAIYFFGNVVFYTLILLRISQPFQLNKCIYYLMVLLISIAAIDSILFCLRFFVALFFFGWIGKTIIFILSVDDFILNSVILISFVYKMRKTV